jgi:hypothetical protein
MLRTVIAILMLVGGCAAAEDAAQSVKNSGERTEIPPNAVKIDANTSRYTDAQGRTWIYRRTPFGVRRYEEKLPASGAKGAAPNTPLDEAPVGIRAREEGDVIYFERPTPFGTRRWSRKKSELSKEEKAAWEQSQNAASSAKSGKE